MIPVRSTIRFGIVALLAALCAVPTAALGCQDGGGEKARLEKRKKELQELLRKEEEKLTKKKGDVGAEYARAADKAAVEKVGSAIDKILAGLWEGLKGDAKDEAKNALHKQVRTLLTDGIGPTLAAMLIDDVVLHLADGAASGQAVAGGKAIQLVLDDLFGGQAFDPAWDGVIKPEISKVAKKLGDELASVQHLLDEAARNESARRLGIPPGMIAVGGGTYRIGIDDKELRTLATDLGYAKTIESTVLQWRSTPAFEAKLEPFFIDQNEVTCAWYATFLETITDKKERAKLAPKFWKDGKYPDGWANRPVTGISFLDAQRFCAWMGRRLPTEEEWEAAARWTEKKGELRVFPWGDKWDLRTTKCNSDIAAGHPLRGAIQPPLPPMLPVGTFPEGRSALGLNDVAGNAYEMTCSPFRPYKGFKEVVINGRRVGPADFGSDGDITLRGGDALKRDIVVTTVNRLSLHPAGRSDLVGFRTALSQARGKDVMNGLVQDGDLETWLSSYPPLPSDLLMNRKHAALALDVPSAYTSMNAGSWDPEKNLPAAVSAVTIVSRRADDFRDLSILKTLAREAPQESLLLGFLRLDFPAVEPALPAGNYFVLWQNAHVEPEEAEAASSAAPEAKESKKTQEEKPRKSPPAKPARGRPVPDAIVLQRRGSDPLRVTLDKSLPPIVFNGVQPTRINPSVASEEIELVYGLPIKGVKDKSFVFSFRLKLAPGQAAKLR